MLQSPNGLAARSLDEVVESVFPEDRSQFTEAIERLPLPNEIVKCQFRINGDAMPLKSIEMRGRIWQPLPSDEAAIMGLFRVTPKANELFERISEANTAVQEAFRARDEALQRANQKLQALASELGQTELKTAATIAKESTLPPKAPVQPAPEPVSDKESTPESASEAIRPEPLKAKVTKKNPSKPTREILSIDKLSAYEEVMKSVARQKTISPTQESLPFDFAQEPVTDFSPPNPAKEGFISAAKRMVAITRKEHDLDASISIADQQSIELEQRKDMLFDILRELLSNVVRHSQAKLCIITLFRDEDEWVLQVEDDGVGLDDKLKSVNAPLNKIGLFQIRTQLALKGGHLDMLPASPNGLIARVRIPVSIRDQAKSS